jgi:proliferating cell nuclear antigen
MSSKRDSVRDVVRENEPKEPKEPKEQKESKYRLEMRTVQSSAFKVLVEAMKDLLTDTPIEFDKTGMKIISMDNSHVVLVHLKLEADKFEYYHCNCKKDDADTDNNGKIVIGVNMLNLYKLIRSINSNDILTLFIDNDDINHLGIKIENSEKNTKTTYRLNLLDLDSPSIHIEPASFESVITLPSIDFQKLCRDMKNIADFVEIKNIKSQLMFSCKGDFCSQETVIADTDTGGGTSPGTEIVQGIFNLEYLVFFTKCTNLCNTVELHLKNDYPLLIKYTVASLGEIKLVLASTRNMM